MMGRMLTHDRPFGIQCAVKSPVGGFDAVIVAYIYPMNVVLLIEYARGQSLNQANFRTLQSVTTSFVAEIPFFK